MAKYSSKPYTASTKKIDKAKSAAKQVSKAHKKASKASTKKSSAKKSTKKHASTKATKQAAKAATVVKSPTPEQIKAEKILKQQRDQAEKAAKAANQKAQASAKAAAKSQKELASTKATLGKTQSALDAATKAKLAEAARADQAEFQATKLAQEIAVKAEANKALEAQNADLLAKLNAFESEEKKMERQIQEQTLKMQQQMEAALDAINDEADEPPLLVDGISSGYASASPAEKLYQDQTAVEIDIDTIDNLDDLSISVVRPEILVNHRGSYKTKDSTSGVGSNKYLDLFAGNVLRELLHSDASIFSFTQFQDVDPDLLDAATQRVDAVHTQIAEECESLIAYRAMINQSALSLDLHQCSEEIGSLMIDSVTENMHPEDGFVEDIPTNLIDFVSTIDSVKSNIDASYSNTKLYYSLIASIYESFMSYGDHLEPSNNQSTKPLTYQSTERSGNSLSKLRKNQEKSLNKGADTVVRKGIGQILPGISDSSPMTGLKQCLCVLSNEILISCGVNRLAGTELGNKYGVTSENPLEIVLGTNMAEIYKNGGVNIPEVAPKKGSLLDFLTVEDTDSKRVVLPFEVNDVTLSKNKYLAGSDYLVEGPSRRIDLNFSDPIGLFSENFTGEVTSSKKYLEDLLALSESTLLSPQGILIRVLEDIYELCLEGSKPIDNIDRNTVFSAVKILVSKPGKSQRLNNTKAPWNKMSSTDITAMLQTIMAQEEQPDYRLAIDDVVIKEVENTDTFFTSKREFQIYFNESWRFYVGTRVTDASSQNVIPIGQASKIRFQIETDTESRSVHKMIIDLADEIMSEAENFASRGGIEASFKDNQGKTAFSKLDYSALISIIQQIYHTLIRNFFHYTSTTRGSSAGSGYHRCLRIETEKNKIAADAILAVLSSYKEGSDFDDLFDEEGNSLAIEGVSSSTKIGKNITMGQLTNAVTDLRNHRVYLKCCTSALQAIATNISQKSIPLSTFQKSAREVITNKVKIENVKDTKLSSFCRLVKLPVGADSIRGLTSMQCSNTVLSKARLEPADGIQKRQKRANLTPGLLEAIRVFHETEFFRGSQNIICVGLPNGMIDKLKTSNVGEKVREPVNESTSEFSIVFSCDNELFSSLAFEDHTVDFDSSLYLFPDSYDNYTPPEDDDDGLLRNPDPLRDLIDKTVFHRIVSGVVTESETGKVLIEQGDDRTYEVLRNHVYSDLVRISAEMTLMLGISEADIKKYTDLNVACYSKEGYDLMRAMQKSTDINMMTSGIEKVVEAIEIDEKNIFYRMGTTGRHKNGYNLLTENDQNDMIRFSSSTLFTAELDRHKILSTSIFDRVFYVQVNQEDFVLDKTEGLAVERKRFEGKTVPKQGNDTFDLTGIYCEVRVK